MAPIPGHRGSWKSILSTSFEKNIMVTPGIKTKQNKKSHLIPGKVMLQDKGDKYHYLWSRINEGSGPVKLSFLKISVVY